MYSSRYGFPVCAWQVAVHSKRMASNGNSRWNFMKWEGEKRLVDWEEPKES